MKKIILLVSAVLFITLPSISMAAGPGSGSKTKYNIRIGNCQADSIKVKWRLDSLMGEATVNASYKWNGDRNCKLPHTTTIWLKVTNGSGGKGYVRVSPVTPKANKGYGYDTTGSPNWNKILCGYSGTRKTSCLDKKSAKNLWKTGDVEDFKVAW